MARHRTPSHPTTARPRRGRRAALVAGTAALLTAGAALVLPSAWAGSSSGSGCADGLVPLADVTVTVNGDSYDAAWLADHPEVRSALAPLDEVVLTYDPDDDVTTPDVPADDCSRGFQLEAFATEGPTFPTSGTQTWADGDGATMASAAPVVTLAVEIPACYYQTDLSSQGTTFEESDYFDGHDAEHPVPHYPGVTTPEGVIAASTGGEGCVPGDEVTPAAPEVRESCSSAGIAVLVTPDAHVAWSYSLDGGAPVAITRARTIVPVDEDAAYSVVVTATPVGGATFPDDAQSEWTFEGVRDCADDVPVEVVPQAPTAAIDCAAGGGLVVTVVEDEDLTWSYALDGGAPVAITGPTATAAVDEDAAYSLVVTATPVGDATVPDDAQSEWTFEGVRDCADDVPVEVVPQAPTAAIDCAAGGGLVVTVVEDEDLTWSYALDGGAPVAITGPTATAAVDEDVAYSLVVTATPVGDATVPDDAQSEWTFEGVRDCGQVQGSVVTPPSTGGTVNAPVRGGAFGAGGLALTGADPRLALLSGALLLLGGSGLVVLARRRAA